MDTKLLSNLANMKTILNDDDLSEVASEFLAAATDDEVESNNGGGFEKKIDKLNDVRDRLQELRGIVSNYEVRSLTNILDLAFYTKFCLSNTAFKFTKIIYKYKLFISIYVHTRPCCNSITKKATFVTFKNFCF